MENYADPGKQLILEVYSNDLNASVNFYTQFGFRLVRKDENFVELSWGKNFLYLEETPGLEGTNPQYPVGNIRIMVSNVDSYWNLAQELGTKVFREIGNREYGLRDFTICGPDGIGLRFATRLLAN